MGLSLTTKQKRFLMIFILAASTIAILTSVYFLVRRQYDIRSRAEQGNCTPVNNQILMSPDDGSLCLSLKGAIDAISDDSLYSIRFQPGEYQLGEKINIEGKNILITGDSESGSKAVSINSTNQISVKNSSVSFEWLEIRASTEDALVYGSDTTEINFRQTHLSNASGVVFDLSNVGLVDIKNSEVFSSSKAGQFNEIGSLNIDNCKIRDNNVGVEISNSSGDLSSNIISNQSGDAITINNPSRFIIDHNTISNNNSAALILTNDESGQNSFVQISNNLIVNNNKGLIATGFNQNLLNISNNDIWNNTENISGASASEEDGNISTDPLFGPSFCLNQSSPAIYGEINRGEFMGYKRFNKPLCN